MARRHDPCFHVVQHVKLDLKDAQGFERHFDIPQVRLEPDIGIPLSLLTEGHGFVVFSAHRFMEILGKIAHTAPPVKDVP